MFSPKVYLYNLVTGRARGPIAALFRWLLYILSLVYGLAVAVISAFYMIRPRRLRCKVISVGNITLGGTGKTVLVQCLAEKLNRKGRRIA
ncbi:MAG: tetraacyldisaccharide 4'-kinase, partial [Candidatus Omnitrophica bacterium]|nr:tetraacyldisaccharide 4'-kinase [Candidatus Omnitrophota bacterium]